jgi:hypothetical protein
MGNMPENSETRLNNLSVTFTVNKPVPKPVPNQFCFPLNLPIICGHLLVSADEEMEEKADFFFSKFSKKIIFAESRWTK